MPNTTIIMKKLSNKLKKSILITTFLTSLFVNTNSQVHKRNVYGMRNYTFSSGVSVFRFNDSRLNNSYGIFPGLELSFTKGIKRIGDIETSIFYDSKPAKGSNRYESGACLNYFRASASINDFLFLNKPPQEEKFHFGFGAYYARLKESFFSEEDPNTRLSSNYGFFGLLEYDVLKEINLNKNKIFNLSLKFSPFISLKDENANLPSGGFSIGAKLKLYDPF